MLVVPNIECIDSDKKYGRFRVELLERGFGTTLGNAMRRVLLGYLNGAAVTRVRIEGVQHEFTSVPGVKEDVMEFLLNVKELNIKSLSSQPGKLTLEKTEAGEIHAADIKPSLDFEIVNPELYLATLDSPEAKFYVEFDVELGEGYREAESSDDLLIGTIPIDAFFTPIRKVNFTVEPTHVSEETGQERLELEVWTDGTISPVDAVSQSANILSQQLAPFIDYSRISRLEVEKEFIRSSIPDETYNMPVEQLDLSVRTMNCLRRGGITTVGELISKGERELLALHNFGQKSKQEVEERLESLGLSLTPKGGEEAGESEEEEEA